MIRPEKIIAFSCAFIFNCHAYASGESAREELLISIMYSHLSTLEKIESCLGKAYTLSVKGEADKSLKQLSTCKACSIDAAHSYYCKLAKYNSFLVLRAFEEASHAVATLADQDKYDFFLIKFDERFWASLTTC